MGKVQNLFPKWYYHGEVEKHESLKALLLYELGTATLTQPKEWNCSVSSSFESDTNQDDFSWHKFNEYISDNFMIADFSLPTRNLLRPHQLDLLLPKCDNFLNCDT